MAPDLSDELFSRQSSGQGTPDTGEEEEDLRHDRAQQVQATMGWRRQKGANYHICVPPSGCGPQDKGYKHYISLDGH